MVKEISDNEIYLLIKYIKSVLWRVAKCLSYIEEARCLKVKPCIIFKLQYFISAHWFKNFCNIFFVCICPLYCSFLKISARVAKTFRGVCSVYNILSFIYMHLLLWMSYPIAQCTDMDHLKMSE